LSKLRVIGLTRLDKEQEERRRTNQLDAAGRRVGRSRAPKQSQSAVSRSRTVQFTQGHLQWSI